MIDDIKAELEKKCPRTVSCADILATVARDATVLAGGPFWMIPFGRKDGRISLAREAATVPVGRESISELIKFFQSKGLNVLDLVVLSGKRLTQPFCFIKDIPKRTHQYSSHHHFSLIYTLYHIVT